MRPTMIVVRSKRNSLH